MEIKNVNETVELIVEEIDQERLNAELGKNDEYGAVRVRAEERCNSTYAEGIKQCEIFKTALKSTTDFIELVNKTFMEADESAKKSNLEM